MSQQATISARIMTAREIVAKLALKNPGKRWAVNAGVPNYGAETSIAVWHDGAWVMVLGRIISGGWAQIPNLLINGKPAVANWLEVSPCPISDAEGVESTEGFST